MKNLFGSFGQNQQLAQQLQGSFTNPLTIAGRAIMEGVPMSQALTQATQIQHQQQQAQMQAQAHQAKVQEQMRAQLLAQQLPQIVKDLNPNNMQEATAKLLAAGASPQLINSIRESVVPKVSDVFNPVTGEIMRKQNGQIIGPGGPGGQQGGGIQQLQQQGGAQPTPQINVLPQQQPTNGFLNTPAGQKLTAQADVDLEKSKLEKENAKLEKWKAEALNTQPQLETARNMAALSNDFYQGPGAKALGAVGAATNAVGGPDFGSSAMQTFEADAKDLLISLQTDMKGQTSDKDLKALMEAIPEATKNPQTNKNLLLGIEAELSRKQQFLEAAEAFKAANGGRLGDFETRWLKYVNTFRLVERGKKPGELIIKTENLNNWEMILDPDFNSNISALQGASKVSPEQSAPSKFKAANGHIYTQEEIDAALRGE